MAVTVFGCATPEPILVEPDVQSSKADGMPSNLTLRDDYRVDVDEPSDLAFINGKLYTVSDSHSRIYEIDDDGDVRDVINIEGYDLEALAGDNEGHFYVGDESRAKVWRLDSDGNRQASFAIDTTDGNSGIEGLAFDNDGVMYVAKEKNPATIIRLDASSGEEINREKLGFTDDLSALTFNVADNLLYALSDEEHKLYRFDANLELLTSWKLPIAHPEGLAFDGQTLYVVSDSEERLYVLELE